MPLICNMPHFSPRGPQIFNISGNMMISPKESLTGYLRNRVEFNAYACQHMITDIVGADKKLKSDELIAHIEPHMCWVNNVKTRD